MEQELIWQGRLHIGDEPGAYGDANYTGLCVELPFTIMKNDSGDPDEVKISIETEDVNTFQGYPGHEVALIIFVPGTDNTWREVVASKTILYGSENHAELSADLSGIEMPLFAAVRIKVDRSVPAGLYDDFIVKKLLMRSFGNKYYTSFGFRHPFRRRIVMVG